MGRGGKRDGAGRKKSLNPTTVIRVPTSKIDGIRKWLKADESPENYLSDKQKLNLKRVLGILQKSLELKANAGGKIKSEIREAITILSELESEC